MYETIAEDLHYVCRKNSRKMVTKRLNRDIEWRGSYLKSCTTHHNCGPEYIYEYQ